MSVLDDIRAELLEHRELKRLPVRKRAKIRRARKGESFGKRPFPDVFVSFDGEGEGADPHVYTMLSCVDEQGRVLAETSNSAGLSTFECLDLLTNVDDSNGEHVGLLVGFSNGYDHSMMLRDLPTKDIYRLMHDDPDTGKTPWVCFIDRKRARYALNRMGTQLTISRRAYDPKEDAYVGAKRSVILADIFKFFQCSAMKAYADWGVYKDKKYRKEGTEKQILSFLRHMKGHRDELETFSESEKQRYNRIETQGYADLARKVVEACEGAGFPLKNLFGAGSVAKSILRENDVLDYLPAERYSKAMMHAFRSAFFGGHFEISRCGPVRGKVWEADIASAYPYELYHLPCLRCGSWKLVKRKVREAVERAILACCRVTWKHPKGTLWGALPFREPDGSTMWPLESKGGVWVWKPELLAAEPVGGVRLHEAWIYETDCGHRPFQMLGDLYSQRVMWGKDGRGKVAKLGYNAIYGTLVQAVGSVKFRSLVWGGCVTSGTRARLIEATYAVGPENVLMHATDAIYATKPIRLGKPLGTGTDGLKDPDDGKPKASLGEWEVKTFDAGVFIVRPGIYFSLDREKLRSRGFKLSKLAEGIDRILERWEEHGPIKPVEITERRFRGLGAGVYGTPRGLVKRRADLCEWYEHSMQVSYDAQPKRSAIVKGSWEIVPWTHPRIEDAESTPYTKVLSDESPEGERLELERMSANDQPDGGCDDEG